MLSPEIVRKVAEAARLDLTEGEIKKFSRDLQDVLLAFKDLDKVPDVKPSFHPLEIKDIMRDDLTESCLSQEESLRNARNKESGFFKGPRAL
jgi:aspartyl-tRNA(Asn)/glutamyl-tRNA(Gln) amidotransferase subunit C